MTETQFGYMVGDDRAWFSTDERKWVNWLKRMAVKYPDEVTIRTEYKDGTVTALVPIKWFKLSPPRKLNLTEEERKERAERMKNSK